MFTLLYDSIWDIFLSTKYKPGCNSKRCSNFNSEEKPNPGVFEKISDHDLLV